MKPIVSDALRMVVLCLALIAPGAMVSSAWAQAPAGETKDPLAGRFGGPFNLMTHDGRVVSDTDFRGRFMLVYFGYTHCPDVCPFGLAVMTAALDLVGADAASIQPLFVTIDPARDTTQLLGEYVKSFHPRLVALTGDEMQISALAKAYKVHRRKVLTPSVAYPLDYVLDHGSFTYLMGPDGKFRTLFPHNTSPERIAELVLKYLRAEEPGAMSETR